MTHERTHIAENIEKAFSCNKCEKTFASPERLYEHEGMHRQERRFDCVTCDESFTKFNDLRKHKKNHNGKEFSCPNCGKKFEDFCSFSNHKREDICVSKAKIAPNPVEKPFKCSECDKKFSKLEALKEQDGLDGRMD